MNIKLILWREGGIYKLTCGSCNAKYISRNFRGFKTKFKDHLLDDNLHFEQGKNFKILHFAEKGYLFINLKYQEIHSI